jgi:hypothetical protein
MERVFVFELSAVLEVDGKRIWRRNGWGDDNPKKYQERD